MKSWKSAWGKERRGWEKLHEKVGIKKNRTESTLERK